KGDVITQSGVVSKGSIITTFSTTSWTTYITTCSNGEISTVTSAITGSSDSIIVVTVTHCEEDKCSTMLSTIHCPITTVFTSCQSNICSEITTTITLDNPTYSTINTITQSNIPTANSGISKYAMNLYIIIIPFILLVL
ncbi:hypothetical protein G210_4970, partial [Candida maltosa Xu316]